MRAKRDAFSLCLIATKVVFHNRFLRLTLHKYAHIQEQLVFIVKMVQVCCGNVLFICARLFCIVLHFACNEIIYECSHSIFCSFPCFQCKQRSAFWTIITFIVTEII